MGKSGIPYFPLDVELDEKMELIEAEYGLIGYAVILKLLQRIYGGHGYYIHWTYEVALLFAKRLGVGGSVVSEIIEAAVKRGVFHKKIFEKYKVLTSEGIQKRYFTAIARRKEIEVDDNILLVQVSHFCRNASILHKNASKTAENADMPAQRKEKERKEEKRKEERMSGAGAPTPDRPPFIAIVLNDGTEYPVYQDMMTVYRGLYPAVDIEQALRDMAGWCLANPTRRKTRTGINRFINGWLAREQNRGGTKKESKPQGGRWDGAVT